MGNVSHPSWKCLRWFSSDEYRGDMTGLWVCCSKGKVVHLLKMLSENFAENLSFDIDETMIWTPSCFQTASFALSRLHFSRSPCRWRRVHSAIHFRRPFETGRHVDEVIPSRVWPRQVSHSSSLLWCLPRQSSFAGAGFRRRPTTGNQGVHFIPACLGGPAANDHN